MSSIFTEINEHSIQSSHPTATPSHYHHPNKLRNSSSISSSDLFIESRSENAAIDDEEFDAQLRLQEMQRRLIELDAIFFEDYEAQLNTASRQALECLLKYNPKIALPLVGAEPNGMLIATWTRGRECLSLRFTARHRLDFAITYTQGESQSRKWGKSTLVTIFYDCPQARRITEN